MRQDKNKGPRVLKKFVVQSSLGPDHFQLHGTRTPPECRHAVKSIPSEQDCIRTRAVLEDFFMV